MTDLEARLDRALKAQGPPPRDPMFRIEVMVRRERAVVRRRLLAACALALGVAILGALGLLVTETLADGPQRLAVLAMVGAALMALLATPYLGAAGALRGLRARAAWAMRGIRFWP